MGLFRWRNKDESRLRAWADADMAAKSSNRQKGGTRFSYYSDWLTWVITRFGSRASDICLPIEYSNDYAIFEWAAYVHYRIFRWHRERELREEQDAVKFLLQSDFLKRFVAETKCRSALELIFERIAFYEGLEEDGLEAEILSHLEQLIIKSGTDHRLNSYDEDAPVIVVSITRLLPLKTHIATMESETIPIILRRLEELQNDLKRR